MSESGMKCDQNFDGEPDREDFWGDCDERPAGDCRMHPGGQFPATTVNPDAAADARDQGLSDESGEGRISARPMTADEQEISDELGEIFG